jgi:tetrahydromethanopterin S-methyltransferase subunit B
MKIEKLERKSDDMFKNLTQIRSLLESIGGLENIAKVDKDITKKMAEIDEKVKKINRLSDKTEKMYIDLNKKMEDFFLYQTKQDSLDEIVKEMMRTVDNMGLRMENLVNNEDFTTLKEDISLIGNRIDEMKRLIDIIVPIVKVKIPEPIKTLQKEKEDIENLMTSLEEEFRKGSFTEKDYKKARSKNQKKLTDIERKLEKEWNKLEESIAEEKPEEQKPKEESKVEEKEVLEEENKESDKDSEKSEEKTKKEEKTLEKPEKKTEEGPKTKEKPPEEPQEQETPETKPKKTDENSKEEKQDQPKKDEKVSEKPENLNNQDIKVGDEKKEKLLAELSDSFDKGLIDKETFEATKKMLESV